MGRKKNESSVTVVEVDTEIQEQQNNIQNETETPQPSKHMQKLLAKAKEARERHKTQKAIVTKFETPYSLYPDITTPVAGFIPKGTLLYISQEIFNKEHGNFWKTEDNRYINKDWDVKEIN